MRISRPNAGAGTPKPKPAPPAYWPIWKRWRNSSNSATDLPPHCGEVEKFEEFFGWGTDVEHRPPPGSLRSPTSPQGGGKKVNLTASVRYDTPFPSKSAGTFPMKNVLVELEERRAPPSSAVARSASTPS